jgi:hypothetical protein
VKTCATTNSSSKSIASKEKTMRILTDPQVSEIKRLLIELERKSNPRTVAYAEKILSIVLQAEQISFKLEC